MVQQSSIAYPHRLGADSGPDPACHFAPDPTFHFDAIRIRIQIKAQNLEKVLKEFYIPFIICKLMRIRIQLINLMRMQMRIWIHDTGSKT
jgi:hypothetical protein